MGAWIEIMNTFYRDAETKSHPTMGAWIEIDDSIFIITEALVAPHDGCVD